MQQPPFYPQQGQPQPSQPPKKRSWVMRHPIITAIGVLFSLSAIVGAMTSKPSTNSEPATQPTQASQVPTSQSINYPPTTESDLHGLAAQGDANTIQEFHSDSVGLTGVCPQPERDVTVDPSVTGQQLAEDLLAYFYGNQLDNPCGAVVFAYHTQSENGNGYTAGRISLNVTGSSGATNIDPNATNLTYTLTLNIGDIATGQQYIVTY